MHYKCNDAGRCDVILIDKGICYLLSSSIKTQQLIMWVYILLLVFTDILFYQGIIKKHHLFFILSL